MSHPGYPTPTVPQSVAIADGANLDAFSRARASFPNLQLSALFDHDNRPQYWVQKLAGGGTANFNDQLGCMDLAVQADGDSVIRQTREFFPYKAMQSHLIAITFVLAAPEANLKQQVGYHFDDGVDFADGIYLMQDGLAEPQLVIKSSVPAGRAAPVLDAHSQSAWNLDTLLGTGGDTNPSGVELDLTRDQILLIDFQYLGVGRVRIGFDIGGVIIYVHEFNHANVQVQPGPYMRRPNLPVQYRIWVDGGALPAPKTMRQICAAVVREGATDEPGAHRVVHTGFASSPTATTVMRTVLGICLKSTYKRCRIELETVAVANRSDDPIAWALVVNPDLGAGVPIWKDDTTSGSIVRFSRTQLPVTVDVDGDIVTAGSTVMDVGYVPGADKGTGNEGLSPEAPHPPICSDFDGNVDQVWLCVRTLPGGVGDETIAAAIKVKEIR